MNPKTMEQAQKLKHLKRGEHFIVPTAHERTAILYAAKVLFAAGAINFEVTTKKVRDGVGFNVIRLPETDKQQTKGKTK